MTRLYAARNGTTAPEPDALKLADDAEPARPEESETGLTLHDVVQYQTPEHWIPAQRRQFQTAATTLGATPAEATKFLTLAHLRAGRASGPPDLRERWGSDYDANARLLVKAIDERLSDEDRAQLETSRLHWDADVLDLLVNIERRRQGR
jgi:hypothetical protein